MITDRKRFTEPQLRFMKCFKDRALLSGAVGAGKSLAICTKGFWLNVRFPGNRGALVRKEGASIRESTLKTLLHGNEKTPPVIPPDWVVSHNKNEKRIVHKTRDPNRTSEIVYTGVDKGANDKYPTKLGSTEFGWIGVDEVIEIDKQDWDWLETRLRHPVPINQIFGATNPASPEHWLYKMFHEGNNETTELIRSTPYDNPFLTEGYINRLEERYSSGIMRDRMLQGKWVAAEGRVYPEFSRESHVVTSNDYRERQFKRYVAGADSGWKNPRAVLVAGITGSGDIYVLDEFYEQRTGIEAVAEWAERRGWKKKLGRCHHDPSEPEEIEKLTKLGIQTEKGINDIVPGISKVSEFIQEGGRDLYISSNCENLIAEFLSYQYPDDDEEEQPIKEDDHLMDALRYMIMGTNTSKTSARISM